MSQTRAQAHSLVLTVMAVIGWATLFSLSFSPNHLVRPLEPTWGLFAAFAMASLSRLLAVRVFQRVLIALDSAFYISVAFVFGIIPAAWMVLIILTADALIRYLTSSSVISRGKGSSGDASAYVITNGGLPALGIIAVGLLYGVDRFYPMSDFRIAVLEPLFAVTFLVVHYSVAGSPQLLAEIKMALWRDFFVRVVAAELFLVPLALAMVFGHEYQGDGLYVLLGLNCLIFNVIFRRAVVSSDKLHERIVELSILDKVGRSISGSLERRTLLSNLATETLRLVRHTSRFMIGLVEPKTDMVNYELFDDTGKSYRRITAAREEGLSGWVMLHREPLLLSNLRRQYRLYSKSETYNDPKFLSWLGVPLVIYDEVIGVMSVQSETRNAYTVDHQRVLATIADQAAVALENSRLYELATVDGLTGLLVRRHFEQRLDEEWSRASRYSGEFTLGIFDLDDFKVLNDTYGHQAGDQALRAAAAVLRSNMRSADIAGRYGGEEFSFILPRTRLAEAYAMADRIRADIDRMRIKSGAAELHLTASIGLASYPDPRALQPDELIALADEAMYHAKRLGKNRVCVVTEVEQPVLVSEGAPRERGVV
jgi:diguanylate cyclase (GGDEF)-like protein